MNCTRTSGIKPLSTITQGRRAPGLKRPDPSVEERGRRLRSKRVVGRRDRGKARRHPAGRVESPGLLALGGFVATRRQHRTVFNFVADERVLTLLEVGDALLADNAEHVAACC
jgi:hypothetical protein